MSGMSSSSGSVGGLDIGSNISQSGLLTRTLVQTPVVQWIMPVFLRGAGKQDLAFVGQDFVRIYQVEADGHLTLLSTFSDFHCKVLGAAVLGVEPSRDQILDAGIKFERMGIGDEAPEDRFFQPQSLVLTLSSAEIIILTGGDILEGARNFRSIPLPASLDPLQIAGKLLAVDSKARAIAAAAPENLLALLVAGPSQTFKGALDPPTDGQIGVCSEAKFIKIPGVIQHMAFLSPPSDDADHVVLLLVKTLERRVLLQRIEWLHDGGLDTLQVHNPQRIDTNGQLPSLLIPLQTAAAFLLASGPTLTLYTELLSGFARHQQLLDLTQDLNGTSNDNNELWASWGRLNSAGTKNTQHEALLVASDGGHVYRIDLDMLGTVASCEVSHIDKMQYSIGNAFAIAENLDSSIKFLVVCGESGLGGTYHLGEDTILTMSQVAALPNWAPNLDLLASNLPHGREKITRVADGLFATSGRQPRGQIVEIRYGFEARCGAMFSMDELRGCNRIWALPIVEIGGLVLLLRYPPMMVPGSARILIINDDGVAVVEDDSTSVSTEPSIAWGIDLFNTTLAIAHSSSHNILIQVTKAQVFSVSGTSRCCVLDIEQSGKEIVAADVDAEALTAIVATVDGAGGLESHSEICLYSVQQSQAPTAPTGQSVLVNGTVTALRYFGHGREILVACTSQGEIHLLQVSREAGLRTVHKDSLLQEDTSAMICENIEVVGREDGPVGDLGILCGLRNGSVICLKLGTTVNGNFHLYESCRRTLGVTGVALASLQTLSAQNNQRIVLASCDASLHDFRQSAGLDHLETTTVWITDLNEPSFQQGTVHAMVQVPHTECLVESGLSGALIVVSGADCLITRYEHEIQRGIPRSLLLRGTPNRIIYSSQLSHFVAATTDEGIRAGSQRGSRKYLRSMIEFIQPSGSAGEDPEAQRPSFNLQAGEKVFAMAEWIYRNSENKKYVFILIGTSIPSERGPIKGRIHIIQPSLRNGRIEGATLATTTKFEAPVYALCLYEKAAYVACTGNWLIFSVYSVNDKKWIQKCKYRLNSPAVHLTSQHPFVYVTTAADSFLTFRLREVIEPLGDSSFSFHPYSVDGQEAAGLHHLTHTPPSSGPNNDQQNPFPPTQVNIMTTKTGQIRGFAAPTNTPSAENSQVAPCLFTAQLPRSITRLREVNTSRVPNEPHRTIMGTTVDGTLYGLAVLSASTWAKLKFVQTLCERSDVVCPFLRGRRIRAQETQDGKTGKEPSSAALPMGFRGLHRYSHESDVEYEVRTRVVLSSIERPAGRETSGGNGGTEDMDLDGAVRETTRRSTSRGYWRAEDMHVDGDVLRRLLDKGGAEVLKAILRVEAEGQGRLADFVRGRLEAELGMVDEVIKLVVEVLQQWG